MKFVLVAFRHLSSMAANWIRLSPLDTYSNKIYLSYTNQY